MAKLFKHTLLVSAVAASLVSAPNAHAEASKEEAIGFGTGAVIGAIVGGPLGFVIGAAGGAIIGNEIHETEEKESADTFESSEFKQLEEQLNADVDWNDETTLESMDITYELTSDIDTESEDLSTINNGFSLTLDDHFSFAFQTGASSLSKEDEATLSAIHTMLKEQPELTVIISGHTDKRGSDEDNLYLSQKRADSVASRLLALGLAEDRIVTKAYGESQAQSTHDDEAGLAADRRVAVSFEESSEVESFASHEL